MSLFLLGLLLIFNITCGNGIKVNTTEDYKALGFPDGRKIVRDSQNNLYLAFRKKYTLDAAELYHIFVAKSTNQGQSWQLTHNNSPIERVGDYMQRAPAIAVDGHDTLHVIWYGNDAHNNRENERQIKYSRSSNGGNTWSPWINVAQVNGYDDDDDLWQEHPTLFVDGHNNLYATWQGKDADYSRSQVKFSRSSDGGNTWSPWINVRPSQDINYSRPTLVSTPNGSILYILAYSGNSSVQQIVWTKSTDRGKSWSPWKPVAPDSQDQRHVSVAIDNKGQLHAVWRQQPASINSTAPTGGDTPSQIRYAVYNGQHWGQPQWVGPNPSAYQLFPSITVAGNNQVWVVWSEAETAPDYPKENPGSGSIYYAVKSNNTWGARTRLREGSKDIYPSLGRSWSALNHPVDLVWLENADASDNLIIYHQAGMTGDSNRSGCHKSFLPSIFK